MDLPVELALANHPIVAGPVPPARNRQNRLADRARAGQQGAGQQFQARDGTAPPERGDDLGDPEAQYRRNDNSRSCNHAALRVPGLRSRRGGPVRSRQGYRARSQLTALVRTPRTADVARLECLVLVKELVLIFSSN